MTAVEEVGLRTRCHKAGRPAAIQVRTTQSKGRLRRRSQQVEATEAFPILVPAASMKSSMQTTMRGILCGLRKRAGGKQEWSIAAEQAICSAKSCGHEASSLERPLRESR